MNGIAAGFSMMEDLSESPFEIGVADLLVFSGFEFAVGLPLAAYDPAIGRIFLNRRESIEIMGFVEND